MKTIREIAEDLATYDEVTLLELLDLTSEMITNRFLDVIEEREAYLRKELYGDEVNQVSNDESVYFGTHFDGYDYDEWN